MTEFVTSSVEDRGFIGRFFFQLYIMLKKNTILQFRFWPLTLAQTIAAPFIFELLLYVLQQADYANQRKAIPHPESTVLPGVLACQGEKVNMPCINLMYTPDVEPYTSIVKSFIEGNAKRNNEPIFSIESPITDVTYRPTKAMGAVPVGSSDFIYDYALRNPNVTAWAVSFNQTVNPINGNINLQYQIWYNMSRVAIGNDWLGEEILSFMRGMDEAIITELNDPTVTVNANMDISMKAWPKKPFDTLSDTIISQLGITFFFCSAMVIFINVLNLIISEKENKLRNGMQMMGLMPCVYWISHFISNSILTCIAALSSVAFGRLFEFKAFTETDFAVSFLVFFVFGEAMLMAAFLITTVVYRTRVGILIGIFIFIIGLLFESFVFASAQFGYIWWDINTDKWFLIGFSVLPFFHFGKIFLDINEATTGSLNIITQVFTPGPGFHWEDLFVDIPADRLPAYSGVTVTIPRPIDTIYTLLYCSLGYAILTWYLDSIIPNEFGKAEPVWFFLLPSYWGWHSKNGTPVVEFLKANNNAKLRDLVGMEPQSVADERACTYDSNQPGALKIVNLRKTFGISKKKVAVNSLTLNLEEGKLLALLGQNGAGKSTSMNILSGLTQATAGDALMFGLSVKKDMNLIQKIMGVCPQHDILFEDLSSVEHLELYCGLKGVPRNQWDLLIKDRLQAVKLWNVRNQRAGTYSGGMKRRLSMVIATIGDPKIIFLDEPTTGMDPVNRRDVWTFIEKFKKGRVIILTTHSMEEADVLGDRIAMMAHGKMLTLGNSIALKNEFGAGYRISIVTDPSKMDKVKQFISQVMPTSVLEDDSAGALLYQIPLSSTQLIPEFVKQLDSKSSDSNDADAVGGSLIKAWGISQTTLEEVFLKLIRKANPHGYNQVEPITENGNIELEDLKKK